MVRRAGGELSPLNIGVIASRNLCSACLVVIHLEPSLAASNRTSVPDGDLTPRMIQRIMVATWIRLPARIGGRLLRASANATGSSVTKSIMPHLALVALVNDSRQTTTTNKFVARGYFSRQSCRAHEST